MRKVQLDDLGLAEARDKGKKSSDMPGIEEVLEDIDSQLKEHGLEIVVIDEEASWSQWCIDYRKV